MWEVRLLQAALGATLTSVIEFELKEIGEVVAVWNTIASGLVGQVSETTAHSG